MTDLPPLTDIQRDEIMRELDAYRRRLDGEVVTITTADDVDVHVLDAVEDIFDDWYADEPKIDWHDFADRLDTYGFTLANMDCPALSKIKRHVAHMRSQG